MYTVRHFCYICFSSDASFQVIGDIILRPWHSAAAAVVVVVAVVVEANPFLCFNNNIIEGGEDLVPVKCI